MTNYADLVLVFLAFIAAIVAMIFIDAGMPRRFSLRSFLIFIAFTAVVIGLVVAYAKLVFTDT
jgi:hypothetical protein